MHIDNLLIYYLLFNLILHLILDLASSVFITIIMILSFIFACTP